MKKTLKGFTLVEVMLVVGLLVGMLGLAFWGTSSWVSYQNGVKIEAGLNVIAAAQVKYLRANPTKTYSALTMTVLTPYLPAGKAPTFPANTTVVVTTSPPTATYGGTTWSAKQF